MHARDRILGSMRISRPVAVVLATLILAAVSACATMRYSESPRVHLVALRPLDIQLFEQRYRVRLRVQNPNPAELPIRGVDFELAVNGRAFASGVSAEPITVPAFGEAVLEVDVASSLVRLIEQFRTLGRSQSLNYLVTGTIAVDGLPGRLPFRREGVLDLGAGGNAEPTRAT